MTKTRVSPARRRCVSTLELETNSFKMCISAKCYRSHFDDASKISIQTTSYFKELYVLENKNKCSFNIINQLPPNAF